MLVEFHLDKIFFDSKCFKDPEIGKFFLNTYAKMWKEFGILVLPNSADQHSFWDLAKSSCPQYIQQDLSIMFAYQNKFKIVNSPSSWLEGNIYCEDENQYSILKNYFDVLFVDESVYSFLEFFETFQKYDSFNSFEVLKASELHNSVLFKNAEQYTFSEINIGDTKSNIWSQRFENISKYSKQVTIIDRYFCQNTVKDIKESLNTSLKFFFEKLPLNQNINLSIISAMGNNSNSNFKRFKKHINDILQADLTIKSKFSSIKLISSKNEYFRDFSHDRYIIFDEKVFRLGKGMVIFSSHDMYPMTFNLVEKSQSDIARTTKARLPSYLDHEELIT